MLKLFQHSGKYCTCHLQDECVLVVYETLYRSDSRRQVGCEGHDWWSTGAVCYTAGKVHEVEEVTKHFMDHMLRKCDERSFSNH